MGKAKTEGGAGGNDPKGQNTPPADPKPTGDPPKTDPGNAPGAGPDIAKAVAEALPGALDALVKSGQLLGGEGEPKAGEGGVFDIDAAVERALGRRQQAQADDEHRQSVNTRLEALEKGPEKRKPSIFEPWRW